MKILAFKPALALASSSALTLEAKLLYSAVTESTNYLLFDAAPVTLIPNNPESEKLKLNPQAQSRNELFFNKFLSLP